VEEDSSSGKLSPENLSPTSLAIEKNTRSYTWEEIVSIDAGPLTMSANPYMVWLNLCKTNDELSIRLRFYFESTTKSSVIEEMACSK
jgi:adenosine deaminase